MRRPRAADQNSTNGENAPPEYDARNKVDVHVGSRVKMCRISVGLSEEKMAEALGVTAERLSAGESGAARFGGRLLLDICRLLQCLPAVFFEDMDLDDRAGAKNRV